MILIQPPDPELLKVKKGQYAGKVVRYLCPVPLVYSVEDDTGNSKFDLEFLARIRRLEYRQFLFLPKGGLITVDSFARLDEIQSVAEGQLVATNYALATLSALRLAIPSQGFQGGNFEIGQRSSTPESQ